MNYILRKNFHHPVHPFEVGAKRSSLEWQAVFLLGLVSYQKPTETELANAKKFCDSIPEWLAPESNLMDEIIEKILTQKIFESEAHRQEYFSRISNKDCKLAIKTHTTEILKQVVEKINLQEHPNSRVPDYRSGVLFAREDSISIIENISKEL
jgi:hypothetical protein